MPDIDQVIAEKSRALLSIDGVVGVGRGMVAPDESGIVVMVTHRTPQIEERVGSVLAGQPFTIQVTGEFQAQ
jgi:hypothetical protein